MPSQNEAGNDAFNLFDQNLQDIPKFSESASGWSSGMSYGYYKKMLQESTIHSDNCAAYNNIENLENYNFMHLS